MSDQMWLEQNTKHRKSFVYMKKDKDGKEDFEELSFEAESESWFENTFWECL